MIPTDNDALATVYHNLGGIDYMLGAFASGERKARAGIALRLSGPVSADALASDLIALAALIDGQQRFDEGERLYRAGLALLRLAPKPDRAEIAVALNGLGVQYARRGRHRAAIRLLRRSAAIKREVLGPLHPSLALTVRNLRLAAQMGDAGMA